MTTETLIEQVISARRDRNADGEIQDSPAWHDLEAADRRRAHHEAIVQRKLERATNPQGLSSTAAAILARLSRE